MQTDYYRAAPENGPRIVVIGGGHGQSTLLRGLKLYSRNLTAIVTVADDGGGSGVLRRDLGMLPPGDIRNCMEALANAEPIMTQLMGYRFTEGTLAGQSFGNLLLAAINGIMPSFDQAVAGLSQVLAITGQVLPVTNANIRLEAEFENGRKITGESSICLMKRQESCRIRCVRLKPEHPKALPEALEAIRSADLIILAPGSLYTSIIPNLLVEGIVEAMAESESMKIYICKVMTESGETEGYTVSDHIQAIFNHSCHGLFDLCMVNSAPLPRIVEQRYAKEGSIPVFCDERECTRLGVELIARPICAVDNQVIRHNPGHVASELMVLYRQRTIRVVEESTGAVRNRMEK